MDKILPDYISINDPTLSAERKAVLRTPAETLRFPLSTEDQEIITILNLKFESETNCTGLAAPQIGFSKRIIIFAVEVDPELKKWRQDLVQGLPKSIWINPEYEPIGREITHDYEGCFSVKDIAAQVPRFTRIKYRAYTPEGEKIKGEAIGFLARAIQHEVDHTNGILFIDRAKPEDIFSIEEYRERRRQALADEK